MTLTGTARHQFYCNTYGSSLTELYMVVQVEYDVVAGWDPISRSPTIEKVTPSEVKVSVGGNEVEAMSWREVVGGLAHFISRQDVSTWESLGLKEDDVRDELAEEQETEEFYRTHRAGVI